MLSRILNGATLIKVSPSLRLLNNIELLKYLLFPIMVLIPSHVRRMTKKIVDNLANIGVSWEEMDWECNPLVNHEDSLLLECIDIVKKEVPSPYGVLSKT